MTVSLKIKIKTAFYFILSFNVRPTTICSQDPGRTKPCPRTKTTNYSNIIILKKTAGAFNLIQNREPAILSLYSLSFKCGSQVIFLPIKVSIKEVREILKSANRLQFCFTQKRLKNQE